MKQKRVTITKAQEKKYNKIGLSFLKNKYTTGFQLEDFGAHSQPTVIYGHDNPYHIRQIKKKIGGKIYPRQSYYKWNKNWKAGKNTKLLYKKTLAKENAEYLQSKYSPRRTSYIFDNAVVGLSNEAIPYSWKVPDVRIYDYPHRARNFKTAYFVTKRIDRNSRFATVVTKKENLKKIRDRLKHERVKKIRVQDYPVSHHSFYEFIDN